MSLLNTITPAQAQGQVANVYQQIETIMGRVPNVFQLYSASPDLLETQWQQTSYFISHPRLSFPLLALTRMLVSQDNQCDYCIDFNAALLIERAGYHLEQLNEIKKDPTVAPLDEKEKAMLLFTIKVTRTPLAVEAADIEHLHSLGWEDRDIFDAAVHASRNMAADAVINAFKVIQDKFI
jgi:uncharacterized peroxidase-related enzyme